MIDQDSIPRLMQSGIIEIAPLAYMRGRTLNDAFIILDNIRSLNNIGSVFRTSDAILIEKIYLCGITATPPHKDIHKTALGSTDTVSWKYVENTIDLIEKLKAWSHCVCENV